jgi:uncharacterized protein YcbK (DUF882 family)
MTEGNDFTPGQLTPNFHLVEFVKSLTASQNNFMEQFHPSDTVVDNLEKLCVNVLQPIRDALPNGVIRVSSGYRCQRLNEKVGGKPTSQHLTGRASDVQYFENGKMHNQYIIDKIRELGIEFDQCILETSGTSEWVHVSFHDGKNRNKIFNLSQ